jgi:dTDP-4-dehydrorhamnose reductase
MNGSGMMDRPKVAILGGRGMLGSEVTKIFQRQGLNLSVYDLPELDITNTNLLRNTLEHTDIVINCASYTDVEKAEQEINLVFDINSRAVGNLGQIAKDLDFWLLHISTDFVFDGKSKKPYNEEDSPNPVNIYGKSKLEGEKLLIETNCSYCILRVEWTYGLNGDNFITKILKRAKTTRQLKIVDDQIGSPTATSEVAKIIFSLVQKKPYGIFHFAADGYTSRYNCAKFILEKMNMPFNITPCKTADFETLADRPLNSRFDCSKIQKLLNLHIRTWQEPLEFFLKQLS